MCLPSRCLDMGICVTLQYLNLFHLTLQDKNSLTYLLYRNTTLYNGWIYLAPNEIRQSDLSIKFRKIEEGTLSGLLRVQVAC
jgi:hypothetical protein